ncbi:hypothetical protein [Kitasatospora sp. NPDC093806]|uniref:hypothetical protein n=1 Tax=Kitasatospora sp. NPDC093806 TaxID=3155075 RepID=UPI003434B91D
MSMDKRRTETAKRWTKLVAVPVGVLGAGAMVLAATHATVTASAWNNNNVIESGSWTKSKVGSDKGTDAVVDLTGAKSLMPGATGTAKVTYTYEPGKAEGKESWGQVILKDIAVTKGQGQPVIIPSHSELAKHLRLKIGVKQGNHKEEKEMTLAEWYASENEGRRVELLRQKLDRNQMQAPTNRADVTLDWKLDDDAPAEAANSGLKFGLGAEIDVVK